MNQQEEDNTFHYLSPEIIHRVVYCQFVTNLGLWLRKREYPNWLEGHWTKSLACPYVLTSLPERITSTSNCPITSGNRTNRHYDQQIFLRILSTVISDFDEDSEMKSDYQYLINALQFSTMEIIPI